MKKLFLSIYLFCLFITIHGIAQNLPNGQVAPAVSSGQVPGAYTAGSRYSYIRHWVPLVPLGSISDVMSITRTAAEVRQTTTYVDGLGRSIQTVEKSQSVAGKDIVTPLYIDPQGRTERSYIPYIASSSDGLLKENPYNDQISSYNAFTGFEAEKYLYGTAILEGSGINRVTDSYKPGNVFAGSNNGSHMAYATNTVEEQVKIIKITGSDPMIPYSISTYTAGQLYRTTSTDENGNAVVDYMDKEGRKILHKIQVAQNPSSAHSGWLCTYYVYNEIGRLSVLITPKAVEALDSKGWTNPDPVVIERLTYQMLYDGRGRNIVKKSGSNAKEYIVYDKRDRVCFSQDGNQRKAGIWLVMFYDELNRPLMTATYKSTETREQLQARMDNVTTSKAVTITRNLPTAPDLVLDGQREKKAVYSAANSITLVDGFVTADGENFQIIIAPTTEPTTESITVSLNPLPEVSDFTPLVIMHYDNYDWAGVSSFNAGMANKLDAGGQPYSQPSEADYNVFGQTTGKQIRIIKNGEVQWLTTTYYYDKKGRIIQTLAENINGGNCTTTSQFDFQGKVLSSYLYHLNPAGKTNNTITILNKFTYDNGGRLISTKEILNDNAASEKLVSKRSYDELGRLNSESLGELDELKFEYNASGLLSAINKDYVRNGGNGYFGMEFYYNYGFSNSQKTGAVSGITWRRKGDGKYRSFGYKYDNADRLTGADYSLNNGSQWAQDKEDYSVKNLTYDNNGNIQSMDVSATVLGKTKTIDKLSYEYETTGDRLINVGDAAGDGEQQDFKDGNKSGTDYTYDDNGNLVIDNNKQVQFIWNNEIDRITEIKSADGQRSIQFVYDAEGNRCQKKVIDGNITTVYSYIDGFVYRNDSLLYFNNAYGRVRRTTAGNLVYDYFITDNLGNIRTVLTEEKETTYYAASFETTRDEVENATYSNRDETKEAIPSNLSWYSSTNKYWSKLNGGSSTGKKVGTGIVLKVMAGDIVDLQTKAYYKNSATGTSPSTPEDILNNLVSAFLGPNASIVPEHDNLLSSGNTILNTTDLKSFITSNQQSNNDQSVAPKAYLNYVLFDENFNMVKGLAKRIDGGTDELYTYNGHLDVTQNGYVYVYTSNESPVDVWFDDLKVTHQAGPLLQESTLYPYGLEIVSQSSKRLNVTANPYLYQAKELDDEFDIGLYNFGARFYDPQTGRFISADPVRMMISGYAAMGCNPVMYVDPDGRFIQFIPAIIGAVIGGATNVIGNWDAISHAPSLGSAIFRGVGYGLTGVVSGALTGMGQIGAATMVSSIGNGAMDLISGKPFNEVVGNTLIGLATAPIAQGVSNAAGEILDPVLRKIRGPLIKYVIDNVVRNVVGAQVATTGVGVMSGKSWGEAFESSIPATITAAVTGVAQGVVSAHFEAKARDINMITGADNKKTISLEKIETVQVNTDVSTPVSGELVNPIEDPQLTHTWGTDRVANDGTGTPNSIYSYTIKDLNKVKNNYIYNSDGKVSFQVDFEPHGTENPSGHGHQMVPPGNLGSGHNGNHVPLENVPPAYHIMPPGYQPKYPIGTTHK